MLKGLSIIALGKDYELISILSYTNLQWNRKYYEPGTFSIEIPLEQYSSEYKYIYTNDRPEMGVITQINYIAKADYKSVNLSGYFLENQLNRHPVFVLGRGNITNAPSWTHQSGKAEDVAFAYFNAFNDIMFNYGGESFKSSLGIVAGENEHRGHISDHERDGSDLGTKIYTILKPSEMSYSVSYDFVTNEKVFSIWSGHDRTQDNHGDNNPVIFSTKYGNIKNPNILIDESSYRNGYVVVNSYNDNNNEIVNVQARIEERLEANDVSDNLLYINSGINRSDYGSEADYINAMHISAHEEMLEYVSTINVEFDALEGSYDYIDDFDLGDKCSIEIPEIGLSADAVLIGCYEVVKGGVNTLTMEFGTPILK